MTKLVRFTKPMRPFGIGDQRLVPDDVAARLAAEGVIEPNPPDFPANPPRQVGAPEPARKPHRRFVPALGQTYLTK